MAIKEREQINDSFKWKLEDIFQSDDEWEECYFAVNEKMGKISSFNGKLDVEDTLLDCLTFNSAIKHDLSRLYQYAHMRRDEDTRKTVYQGMDDRAMTLYVQYGTMTSFITPELTAFDDAKLDALINNKRFRNYSVFFEEIKRNKKIILSKKEEKIISEVQLFADNAQEVFTMFDNADIKFKPVDMCDGTTEELSHGSYSSLLQNDNQDVRKNAFESMFGAYKDMINTLSANYAGNVKADWFFAKIRGFQSALDYSMYCENVPSTCYKKLLATVNGDGLKPLHKYIALRKRALGVKTLNMYDLYVPIVNAVKDKTPYSEAVKAVKNALSVMGKEYLDVLSSSFDNGWIDVYENKGKKSGAYSWGTYGVHPFVLLNYDGTLNDIFTIAHELGHSMHSYYSNANQCEEKSDYEIFVAEIASTVNEVLLLKYMLRTATGDLRKYLLSYYLDMFRTTLFRQTMFAEFEVYAHETVEKGEPMTADNLSQYYFELNKKYYGRAVKHNDLIRYEWARIPHFFTSYYVYKYATGLTAAVTIADNILSKGEEYFKKYKQFLSAGGSLPPLDILRLADVDLETDTPYKRAMKEFESTLDELEKLMF